MSDHQHDFGKDGIIVCPSTGCILDYFGQVAATTRTSPDPIAAHIGPAFLIEGGQR